MANQLEHRGPDDQGIYTTHSAGVAFRRLSVIDLTGGHQPIGNENGMIQVVLNGEIYNYRELTVELQKAGHIFTTRSDTEVIVHGYEQWGDDVFQHLRGMFGIAILDTKQNRLIIARDRFGIKPVYWALRDGLFLFASEIKSLLAHPAVSTAVDWSAVGEYLSLRYSLGPGTMFDGIQRLSCATRLIVDSSGISESAYWQMRYDRPVITSMEEAEEELEAGLNDAVQSHLISDVPLGLFLSGGADSTAMLAFMTEHSSKPVKSFTANLGGVISQDVKTARLAAKHFKADHHEVMIEPTDVGVLQRIIWHLDQPIGDPAVLPTYLLSQAARKEVTVVLTGEGSDETNAGYRTYLRDATYSKYEMWLQALSPIWPLAHKIPGIGKRLEGVMRLAQGEGEIQRWLITKQMDTSILSEAVRKAANSVEFKLAELLGICTSKNPIERMQHLDRGTWMSECTLMKADRMTMAAGLEARVPFLDHPLAELAARISPTLRLQGRQTKCVLRRILHKRYAPAADRPQSGFILPLGSWFRDGEFNRWVSDVLSTKNLAKRGAVDSKVARNRVDHFLKTGNDANMIWRLLCLELWFRQFID